MKLEVLHFLNFLIAFVYLNLCPYSKVEESFNIQATNDILYHGHNISEYDHKKFPGVVPRTFVGPLILSIASYPIKSVSELLGFDKFISQIIIRSCLGMFVLLGLKFYSDAIKYEFGRDVVKYLLILTLSQFHFLFYCSRTLPNIFALVIVLFALGAWIRNRHSLFLFLSGISIIIFRADTILLLSICLCMSLIRKNTNILFCVKNVIPFGILCLIITVVIDSYFWGDVMWPEGMVLWFNTVLNKSSDYGTSPFLWYFYSALPRALLTSVLLLPWGLYCDFKRCSILLIPAIVFVFLFSFLPHKELRFIIYVFPIFNTVSARAFVDFDRRKTKSKLFVFLYFICCMLVLVNIFATFMFLSASYYNYPGGVALVKLHQYVPCTHYANVHIDNKAAQTGVSRFGELCEDWIYNKTEHLIPGSKDLMRFTHLIAEKDDINLKAYIKSNTHKVLEEINGYSGIKVEYFNINKFSAFKIPFPIIKTSPQLLILQSVKFNNSIL